MSNELEYVELNNSKDDKERERRTKKRERRIRRKLRKQRAQEKEDRRWIRHHKSFLWYKVVSKRDEWHPIIWYPLSFIAVVIDRARKWFRFLAWVLCTIFVMVFCIGVLLATWAKPTYDMYSEYAKETVNNSSYDDFRIAESSIIYDKNNRIIANLHETADTEYLTYNEIPENVVNAFIAIEDRTFWTNAGIDFKGIVRVLYHALKSDGEEVHGASTITQQLARNVFLNHAVSMERKGKEILISMYLNDKYSKKDIMEFYCNDICFANGIYGIQGAAKAYFGKDVRYLSLKQIAYLCAIPNRPEYYNPYKDETRALKRCEKILNDMFECGYITEEQLKRAESEEITIQPQKFEFNDYESSYAIDCAIKYLMKLDDFEFKFAFEDMDEYKSYRSVYTEEYEAMRHKLYTGGYKIYTSLDTNLCAEMQAALDKRLAFNQEVDEETGLYTLQGALTCIDNETGLVVAVVGGRSQELEEEEEVEESEENTEEVAEESETTEEEKKKGKETGVYSLNRAYQSYRQPGSSFKPIAVYTPALETGYMANTTVENIDVKKAKEKGADPQKMHGTAMPLRQAVEKSLNGVAWQVFDKITPAYGMSFINNMQFSKICPDDFYNASALGGLTYGVTTVEMAGAYCALANHGDWTEPTCIKTLIAADGTRYTPSNTKEIYTAKAADNMVDILRGVLIRGTAAKLGWSKSTKMDAFGKTGTTNDSKDGWFCGATPYYSMAVWVGFDMPKTMPNLYGATYPGQIWKDAMLIAIDGEDPKDFERLLEDESYQNKNPDLEAKGYYNYLEGRDDNEVLAEGYTVGNYREDRVIGEDVYAVIGQINSLNMADPAQAMLLDTYYAQGCSTISSIYSRKYTAEMQGYLDAAYASKKAQLLPAVPVVPAQQEGQ